MHSYFNQGFVIQMTKAQAQSAAHQGQCYDDVKALCKVPSIARQLKKLSDETIKDELKEYGAWDETELLDRTENEHRLIWIAAGNIVEETKR